MAVLAVLNLLSVLAVFTVLPVLDVMTVFALLAVLAVLAVLSVLAVMTALDVFAELTAFTILVVLTDLAVLGAFTVLVVLTVLNEITELAVLDVKVLSTIQLPYYSCSQVCSCLIRCQSINESFNAQGGTNAMAKQSLPPTITYPLIWLMKEKRHRYIYQKKGTFRCLVKTNIAFTETKYFRY